MTRPPFVIQVVGRSGAGKTLLLERAVARLNAAGHRCAVVKHAHHPPDVPGKDTARFATAGASLIVFSGPRSFVHFPGEAIDLIPKLPVDVVLVEGYSRRSFGGPRFHLESPAGVPAILRLLLAEVEFSPPNARPHRKRARRTVRRAVVLLGESRRLRSKFDREVGGRTILDRVTSSLRSAGLHTTIVSVSPRESRSAPVLVDRRSAGPLGGLAAALPRVPPPFFLVGGDMPFLEPEVLRRMRGAYDGRTLVPLSADGVPQVLHAIYGRVSPSEVRGLLRAGRGLAALVDRLDARGEVRWWPHRAVGPTSLTDVDSLADLRRARRLARRAAALPR